MPLSTPYFLLLPPSSPRSCLLRLCCGDLQVEREQARQDFAPGSIADGVAHLTALIGVEAVSRVEILPAIAGQGGRG